MGHSLVTLNVRDFTRARLRASLRNKCGGRNAAGFSSERKNTTGRSRYLSENSFTVRRDRIVTEALFGPSLQPYRRSRIRGLIFLIRASRDFSTFFTRSTRANERSLSFPAIRRYTFHLLLLLLDTFCPLLRFSFLNLNLCLTGLASRPTFKLQKFCRTQSRRIDR